MRRAFFLMAVLPALIICNHVFAGCVTELLMEEGDANVVGDTSGSANNAYFVGQPIWQGGHGGVSQYCLRFDGSNYFEAPDSPSLDSITTGFTMTAWINVDQNSASDTIVWKLGAFRIWKNNANLTISLTGVSTVQNVVLTTIPNGLWQHIAITYNGQWLKAYVNGTSVYSNRVNGSNVSIATSNNPLRVGWYNSGSIHYRGQIDNIRLYNNALSSTEIIADKSSDIIPTQPLTIIQSGVAATAIVIPTGTTIETETVAANELQYHIKQATGITLGIYEENNKPTTFNGLIYIGKCDATASSGINAYYLDDNAYVVRNVGNDLFLSGHDSTGSPLGCLHLNDTRIGTMLAVYKYLEKYMGVKWLWPGPNGEVIPTTHDLVANNISIIGKPVLKHTRLQDYNPWNWGFSTGGWASNVVRENYMNAQSLWMRRQGFCRSINLEYSHVFENWWDTYHDTHPEYFNMLPDGTRRPDPYYQGGSGASVSMCLSDPNFHKQIVNSWIATGRPEFINCCENDTAIKCTCPRCMAWDVQDPDLTVPWSERLIYARNAFNTAQSDWYKYLGSMSTRYAKFILAVQQEAESRGYANAKIFGFAYWNYYKKPLDELNLNNRITIGVVPDYYFPWTDARQQTFRDSWNAWADGGAQLFLRPNYFLAGYNFPVNFSRRFGSDFLFALRRDMFATIFDSLTGQWSTQAPNLYMLARVQTHVDTGWENWGADVNGDGRIDIGDLAVFSNWWLNDVTSCEPGNRCGDINGNGDVNFDDFVQLAGNWHNNNAEVESILDEFYNSFGHAKTEVRAYFDYWEEISDAAGSQTLPDEAFAPQIFTPSVMAVGRTLMTNAQNAAEGDPVAVRLVNFLEKGLTNAEKTLAAIKARQDYINYGNSYLSAWQAAHADLNNYRALVEADFICNMGWLDYFVEQYW